MNYTILVIGILVVLVILLAGTAAFATSKRIDVELELAWWKLGQQSLIDRENAVARHEQRLTEFAGQIADDIIQACQEGWDEELHWMLHDETWVPSQDPHQGG